MCDDRERLLEYLYGESDDAERRLVDAHLATCETCRDELAGLRQVRADLLAWDVPDHGSVWTPFAPTRAVVWYRQVPAWAMAAAAGVMFLVGGAGGVVTHAYLTSRAPAVAPVAEVTPAPAPVVATASLSDAQYAAIEARVLAAMRQDLARRAPVATAAPVSTVSTGSPMSAADLADLQQRVQELQKHDAWHDSILSHLDNDVTQLQKRTNGQIGGLRSQLADLRTTMAATTTSGSTGIR